MSTELKIVSLAAAAAAAVAAEGIISLALDLCISWVMMITLDFQNTENGFTTQNDGEIFININEQIQSNEGINYIENMQSY